MAAVAEIRRRIAVQLIAERGFNDIATVDIMDEEGEMNLDVADTKHIKHDIVGSHLQNYDMMVNLASISQCFI